MLKGQQGLCAWLSALFPPFYSKTHLTFGMHLVKYNVYKIFLEFNYII